MKKTKVKKIKKIPRYYDGSPAVLADFPMQLSTPGLKADAGAALKTMAGKAGLAIKGVALSVAGAVGSVASPIAGALGIEQGLTGLVIGAIGSAVGMANPIAGMALQIAGATAGGRAKLDKSAISTTSDINDAVSHNTGWVGALFGADRDELLRNAAGIQNSKQSVELTSHAQEQWSNDPRNQRAVLNVKDGGVVPELVHAKVSKGELYYDPYNKTLSRVPGSPNKPNTDDDVDAFLARGGMVVTNNDEQPLINGKTQAIALAPMVDKPNKNMSKGTIEARDRIVRKVTRLNELYKTEENKPNDIVYANTGENNIGNNENQLLNWLRGKTKGTILGKSLNPPVDGDTRSELEKVRDRMKHVRQGGSYFDDPHPFVFQPQTGFGNRDLLYTNDGVGGFDKTTNFGLLGPQSTRKLFDYDNSPYAKVNVNLSIPKDAKFGNSSNRTNNGSTVDNTNESHSKKITPFKLSKEVLDATTPGGPTKNDLVNTAIKRYGGNDKPIYRPLTLSQPMTLSRPDYEATSGYGMLDAYQWLSALVPLMDRERAEKVTLSRPTWKGIPVGVDVLKQLQDAQLGYDMSNYSTTQGGYTAGQQLAARVAAADNLARQRAAIHAWQTQQQNENIAKNIASYNDHTRLLSEINDREADMNAANRGAARNINRQNRSQAFKNIGQILRDKKQYDMDLIRTEILKPMIEAVYENSDVVIPMLNKQIKKKSTKKSKGK